MPNGATYLYPFGNALTTRSWSNVSREYYGFNGKEKDSETANDDFPIAIGVCARIYDGRLVRCLSLDPMVKNYPSQSPYTICNNNAIFYLDPYGKEVIQGSTFKSSNYLRVLISLIDNNKTFSDAIYRFGTTQGHDLIFNIDDASIPFGKVGITYYNCTYKTSLTIYGPKKINISEVAAIYLVFSTTSQEQSYNY